MLQSSAVYQVRIYANTGGPMSRTRKQNVHSTLLGREQAVVCCPMRRSLGLHFAEGESALDVIDALLRSIGMDGPDKLRSLFTLPPKPLMARPLAHNHLRLCTVVDGCRFPRKSGGKGSKRVTCKAVFAGARRATANTALGICQVVVAGSQAAEVANWRMSG